LVGVAVVVVVAAVVETVQGQRSLDFGFVALLFPFGLGAGVGEGPHFGSGQVDGGLFHCFSALPQTRTRWWRKC